MHEGECATPTEEAPVVTLAIPNAKRDSFADPVINRPPPQHGWVLDGFPRTQEHASALVNSGIIPDRVIVLQDG